MHPGSGSTERVVGPTQHVSGPSATHRQTLSPANVKSASHPTPSTPGASVRQPDQPRPQGAKPSRFDQMARLKGSRPETQAATNPPLGRLTPQPGGHLAPGREAGMSLGDRSNRAAQADRPPQRNETSTEPPRAPQPHSATTRYVDLIQAHPTTPYRRRERPAPGLGEAKSARTYVTASTGRRELPRGRRVHHPPSPLIGWAMSRRSCGRRASAMRSRKRRAEHDGHRGRLRATPRRRDPWQRRLVAHFR
jgi:hypothetical protein